MTVEPDLTFLSDQTSLNYTSSMISTASSGTELSAEITDVSVQGE
ncbi:hypothetical protein [Streptomyces sp. NPDC088847]